MNKWFDGLSKKTVANKARFAYKGFVILVNWHVSKSFSTKTARAIRAKLHMDTCQLARIAKTNFNVFFFLRNNYLRGDGSLLGNANRANKNQTENKHAWLGQIRAGTIQENRIMAWSRIDLDTLKRLLTLDIWTLAKKSNFLSPCTPHTSEVSIYRVVT